MHRKNIKDGITNISNKQFIDGCLLRHLQAWNKLFVSLENKIILNYKKKHIDYFKESNLLKKTPYIFYMFCPVRKFLNQFVAPLNVPLV